MTNDGRRKKADLAGSVGAGIIGAGLGALAAQYLNAGPFVAPLIAIGVVMHAWGMFERHRLETAARRVWWAETLYWLCWLLLAAMVVVIVVTR
jgi:hypothetical protein